MAGIVIIGGGVTGLSAGIHLLADSEQAQRVTGGEQFPQTGAALAGLVHPLLVQAQIVLPARHIVLLQLQDDLVTDHSDFGSSKSA